MPWQLTGLEPLGLDGSAMLESNAVSTFTALAPGKVAAVVTALEMRQAPQPLAPPDPRADLALRQVRQADLAWYRDLFRRVGEPWLWFSRLRLSDEKLAGILHHPEVELYALSHQGKDEGLLELDRRVAGEVELSFFGVTPALIGKGAGAWLMRHALYYSWRGGCKRLWVHTCTFDHHGALDFYRRFGFVATGRFIEVADDPRLIGVLDKDAAPHVPLIQS